MSDLELYIFNYSAEYGYYDVVKKLLEYCIDPCNRDNQALRMAAFNCHIKIMKLLIKYGSDINTNNNIIFKYAMDSNNKSVINALINKYD